MGENTSIEWATSSFNPWIGCQRVSPGCQHCYAEVNTFTRSQRARGRELWGPRGERHVTSEAKWAEPLKWNREAERTGVRPRVFPSMCDPFEDRDDLIAPRAKFFELVEQTPYIDWLLLTKRPENVLGMVPEHWNSFPRNVWMGTSAEDQQRWDERLPHLVSIPAFMAFVSAEPLLGPIDCGEWLDYVEWVIIGGESGPGARPLDVEWVRSIVTQCREAESSVFVKQLGAVWATQATIAARQRFVTDALTADRKGGDPAEWSEDLRIREFPRVPGVRI